MKLRVLIATAVVLGSLGIRTVGGSAQEPVIAPPAMMQPGASRTAPPIPVRVTVVLARYQGEKRISSMPYVIGVMASGYGPAQRTRLRMGTDVPVIQTVFGAPPEGKSPAPQTSYTYRNVGTSIDCTATYDQSISGVFNLALTVADSSIGLEAGQKKSGPSAIADNIPAFRNFNSEFTAVLKDGQTMQYTSATDPVTGEVTKIDVTVNVMK